MLDGCGRKITYLRLSITDRCNFRCSYCLPEDSEFEQKSDLLSYPELIHLTGLFIASGIRKIRITGGEPLVRGIALPLIDHLGEQAQTGVIDEVTMTTNGFFLSRHAHRLFDAGMQRINVSLDTLDEDLFAKITGRNALDGVINGIDQAIATGLKVKVNCVVQRGINDHELDDMVHWCGDRGLDLTLIETMPIGIMGHLSMERFIPLIEIQDRLAQSWSLLPSAYQTGGPARYMDVAETGQRIGFITPQSHSFCGDCNRIRMTATGKLYPCLGYDSYTDLRNPLREGASDEHLLAMLAGIFAEKPKGHSFAPDPANRPVEATAKSMALTGG